jgi:hypothetical protein
MTHNITPPEMLASLIEQRKKIDLAIAAVEPLVSAAKKRGRPSMALMAAREIAGNGKRAKRRPTSQQ